MCGIALLLAHEQAALHSSPSILDDERLAHDIEYRLRQRGPDHFGILDRAVDSAVSGDQWRLRLCSAVLHLRGDALTPQPFEDALGNVLCWNGEIFGYRDVQGRVVDVEHGNDTQWLSELLARETDLDSLDNHDGEDITTRIVGVLRRIHGPFAFVWFHAATQRVFFGHDRFGRRSLLIHSDASEQLTTLATSCIPSSFSLETVNFERLLLSSVALFDMSDTPLDFVEVPANGIFVLDLRNQQLAFHAYEPLTNVQAHRTIMAVEDRYHCGLPPLAAISDTPLHQAAHGLLTALSNAVGVRVRTIPSRVSPSATARVGILFSGGLDSVVLAALTHFHVHDADEPIDLLNVCFDADAQLFQSPDRLAAQVSYRELCVLYPTRRWRFVCVDEAYDRVVAASHKEIRTLLHPCDTHMDFNIGAAFWCLSRCHGFVHQGQDHIWDVSSSAVDLNAFLTQQRVPSDQREREAALQALTLFGFGDGEKVNGAVCPVVNCKRKRKPECLLGICRVCCFKVQKLLAKLRPFGDEADCPVIVNDHEKRASRLQLVAMVPHLENAEQRVDDFVRVYETHWVSREIPLCRVHRNKQPPPALDDPTPPRVPTPRPMEPTEPYTTTARVLLVGIGADEQLGGYGRHKTAFLQGGVVHLQRELAYDMARIWKRNLGRDDRCIAAHAREARFPFLDEQVVQYIASLPLASVCDFTQPRGRGDKLVLREAAQLLGLNNCVRLAKRAIQFGSRIAKHANVAAFGSNRQASGDAKITGNTQPIVDDDE